jgi:HSP20 family protein
VALEYREADELVVQADLPGLQMERDLEVWISRGVLHLRARGPGGHDGTAVLSDLRDGEFARDIAVTPGAGPGARASYDGTRLEVRVPLVDTPAAEGRRVAIELRTDVSWPAPPRRRH